MPRWKNILKGIFDEKEDDIQFIITGSARLDWFRKSGDSLAGRYFLFHLLPVTLREFMGAKAPGGPPRQARAFIEERISGGAQGAQALSSLLRFSGFPEPLTRQSEAFHGKWQEAYTDQLVREDLRDLTRIRELENVAALSQVLPSRIGSPLSINALREDLEVSYSALKNYLRALELTYVVFTVSPYSRRIARSVRKERKAYFYDWTRVPEPAPRFENFVAVELSGLVALWNDRGLGPMSLSYVRTKDGKETDFLVVCAGKPWLLLEAKLSRSPIESHHRRHSLQLGGIPIVALVAEPGIAHRAGGDAWIISASRFFA